MGPGAGKLRNFNTFKNETFWGSQKSRPGPLLGGHFGSFFKAYFFTFLGGPKTSNFHHHYDEIRTFKAPGGTSKRGPKRAFFGVPFWTAKTGPGGVSQRLKCEEFHFWLQNPPPGELFPGVARGVPGDPGGSLGEASERLIYLKKI